MRQKPDKPNLASFPDGPGVYLFYSAAGHLVYVGKSKSLRSRIRAHFAAREERRFMRGVKTIKVEETAGELGALLLESRYIKELRPLKNIAARRRRRIIVAVKKQNKLGFAVVSLKPIDYWSVDASSPVLGLFKTRTQAMEYLSDAARAYRLCPKLLKLEQPKRYCFSYHLGRCDGACMGEGDPVEYNARLDKAFDDRRIKAWPFAGPVVVEETSPLHDFHEHFVIDNWCLLGSYKSGGAGAIPSGQGQHRFDYDSYKILYAYLTDPRNRNIIRPATASELAPRSGKIPP
ncbi:MAG TPA: GIY-YIG nuclease family protein [Bacteroidota bacterium]